MSTATSFAVVEGGELPTQEERRVSLPTLELAVAEACQLLRFAQRNGVFIAPELLREIVMARELFDNGRLTGEALVGFQSAYHQLACALAPVTIKSIMDSVDEFGEQRRRWIFWGAPVKIAKSSVVVGWYRTMTVLALVMLLSAHSYWFIGSRLLANIRAIQPASTAAAAPAKPAGGFFDNKQETEKDIRAARFNSLHSWLDLAFLSRATTTIVRPVTSDHLALQRADDRLEVFRTMILPLLYGWMGALTYVLRQLSQDIQRRLFRTDSKVQYQLRVLLGALAGLAIGWFVQQADDGSSGTGRSVFFGIAPTALAFLAGYSVELFFSAMDNLVGAFSSSSSVPKK